MQNIEKTLLFDHQAQSFAKNKNKEKNKKRTVRLVLLSLLVVIGIVLVLGLLKIPSLYAKVSKPFQKLQSDYFSQNKVNLDNRVNLLVLTNSSGKLSEIGFYSFEKGSKKVVALKFPAQTQAENDSGSQTMNDLVNFQDSQVQNIDKLAAALTVYTGYFFDGYILVNNPEEWQTEERLDSIFTNLYSPFFVFQLPSSKNLLDKKVKTSLSLSDFYNLTKDVKTLEPARFDFVPEQSYLNKAIIDQQALKSSTSFKLQDSAVSSEGAVVEIVNASGEEGVGSLLKFILTNQGANVVSVSSSDQVKKVTEIESKEKNLKVIGRLVKLLKQAKITQKDGLNQIDVKIIVGQDFAKLISF